MEEDGLAKADGEGLTHGVEGLSSQFHVDARGLVGEPTVQVSAILIGYFFLNIIINSILQS